MEKDYTALGYSEETAASVMGVLVLISSESQAVGSDVQVRNGIESGVRLSTLEIYDI